MYKSLCFDKMKDAFRQVVNVIDFFHVWQNSLRPIDLHFDDNCKIDKDWFNELSIYELPEIITFFIAQNPNPASYVVQDRKQCRH